MPAAFLTPALATLRAEIDALYPNRSKLSDGWLGDAAHAARHSDHNPEEDGSVDAIDVTHDPANGCDCFKLREQVKHDPRIVGGGYVIFNGEIYNPDISDSWRDYDGENQHEHHMHVSVADRLQNDTSPWLKEVDEVTEQDLKRFETLVTNSVRTIVQNNTSKIQETVQNNEKKIEQLIAAFREEIDADRKAQTAAFKRAIWLSQGKTVDEIRELMRKDAELDEEDK